MLKSEELGMGQEIWSIFQSRNAQNELKKGIKPTSILPML